MLTIDKIIQAFKDLYPSSTPVEWQLGYARSILAGYDTHYIHSKGRGSGRTTIQLAIAVALARECPENTIWFLTAYQKHAEDIKDTMKAAALKIWPENLKIRSFRDSREVRTSRFIMLCDHFVYEDREASLRNETRFALPYNE